MNETAIYHLINGPRIVGQNADPGPIYEPATTTLEDRHGSIAVMCLRTSARGTGLGFVLGAWDVRGDYNLCP